MDPCIENLKGKVLEKPQHHLWRLNKQANKNEEYKYTVESTEEEWTPFNSNLQMQGIKVGDNENAVQRVFDTGKTTLIAVIQKKS